MYTNKATINTTASANGGSNFSTNSNYYWSSTEYDNSFAWRQNFNGGTQYNDYKEDTNNVRAVRAF